MAKYLKENSYLSNKQIRKAGVQLQWTQELLLEWMKCRDDIVYFANNYFYIVHVDKGKIKIPLTSYQEELLRTIQDNRFTIVLQSRQSFKTTTLTIAILHYMLFNRDKQVALLGNKAKQSKGVLSRIKLAYELLPDFLQHGVVEWNMFSVSLENGSSCIASATSASSIRGDSVSFLLIDEAAFVENWDEFYMSTYSTITSGRNTKIVMISTANKMNHFYKLWIGSQRNENDFVPYEVNWWDVPGRDDEWKRETISNTSEEAFLQEHENVFLGSSNTLVSLAALRKMVWQKPIYDKEGMKVYKDPIPDHTYMIAVDTSRGTKQDYSAFSIIDVTHYPFEQVVVYRNNEISYLLYPKIVLTMAKKYNNAWAIIENNDIGGHVVSEINYEYEYDNVISNSSVKYELGVKTTKRTKAIGCQNIKSLIETQKFIINDFDTISEFSTFESKYNSYEAAKGATDDIVMGLVLFGWFSGEPFFQDLTNRELKMDLYERKMQEIEEELLPEPVLVDNANNTSDYTIEDGEVWSTTVH